MSFKQDDDQAALEPGLATIKNDSSERERVLQQKRAAREREAQRPPSVVMTFERSRLVRELTPQDFGQVVHVAYGDTSLLAGPLVGIDADDGTRLRLKICLLRDSPATEIVLRLDDTVRLGVSIPAPPQPGQPRAAGETS